MDMLQGALSDAEREALDAHLDGCSDCTLLVADLTQLVHPSEEPAPQSGDIQMGRYTVRRQVGAGGMGVVYEAWDPTLKRKVALKVLRADLIDPQARGEYSERLLREAQLLASVSHPNILTVYEVLTWDEQIVMVVHFVDGVTLRQWLERDKPSWQEVIDVYLKVGAALGAAHERGLIHRDVKPANILIEEGGRVWLTDFGLACVIGHDVAVLSGDDGESSGLTLSSLTRTGAIVGTPAYMSPEQHLAVEVDSRTDQFSYCAALFEALYGHRPFVGATRRELSLQVCTGSLRESPEDTEVPHQVYAVLARGLARNPEDRHLSMAALLKELSAARFPRRRLWFAPGLLVVSVIVLALMVVGAVMVGMPGVFGPGAVMETPTSPGGSAAPPEPSTGSEVVAPVLIEPTPVEPTAIAPQPVAPTPVAAGESSSAELADAPPEPVSVPKSSAVEDRSADAVKPAKAPRPAAIRTPARKTTPAKERRRTPVSATPVPTPAFSDAQLLEAQKRREAHQRSNALLAEAQRHLEAGRGAQCLKALDELVVVSRQLKTPYHAATSWTRAVCLMLSGRCEQGKKSAWRYLHKVQKLPNEEATNAVEGTARKYCR